MHLACLINNRNISTLVASKALRPKGIYLFYNGGQKDRDNLRDVSTYFENLYPDIALYPYELDDYRCDTLREAADNLVARHEELIFDLSNGNPIAAMILHEQAKRLDLPVFVFSERNERAVLIKDGHCQEVQIEDVDLQVEDFVESGGGSVYAQSTEIFESEPIKHLLKWQIANYQTWMATNHILKTQHIMKGSDKDSEDNMVFFHTKKLSKKQYGLILSYLLLIHEYRIAKYKKMSKYHYRLEFHHPGYKHYIMGTGFWLEALTYFGMSHLNIFDDVRSGVSFFWDQGKELVNNELDVLAVYREKLVVVSCKDTSKYANDDLNSLLVSATRLGGPRATPILVSTAYPDKGSVVARAQELGVHLLIFQGDLDQFMADFKKIIEKERP